MHTTARIESVCRTSGHDYVASAPAMPDILPKGIETVSLGPVELRGKAQVVDLFALRRSNPTS
jgi:hypothetical protein